MIPKKILSYLEKENIKYEVIEHRKVYTALDSAQTQRIKPQEIVKTMVMKIDNNYCLALLPANKNICKDKFKKAVNVYFKKEKKQDPKIKLVKKVDFAKEVWMKKNLPGKIGATPAFGKLLKLLLFMDGSLFKLKKLILNTGEYTESFKINTNQFIKLEEPVKASFSKPKNKK
ncbi:MAG: YbaK/EbsC family protein [Patescibacteria group bacterium]